MEGVLTWTVDGQQIEVGPGQALCVITPAKGKRMTQGAAESC
ncbi:MAG: hypothetical protein U0R19_30235 [Bryobacteraceae bacterium]